MCAQIAERIDEAHRGVSDID